MLNKWRGRGVKATSLRVTLLPAILLMMLVLADSCSCPVLDFLRGAPPPSGGMDGPPEAAAPESTAAQPALPPALVQHNFQRGTSAINAISFPHNVGAGDLIVVAITTNQQTVLGVRDNQSNPPDVFQRVGPPVVATPAIQSDSVDLWYASNVSFGQTTVTVSFSAPPGGSLGATSVGIYEYSGLNKTSPLHQTLEATGAGNKPDAGALPNPLNRAGLYFLVGVDGGPDINGGNGNTPIQAGTGFTLEDQQDNSSFERFYAEDSITLGTSNASFSIAYQANWGVICAVFIP
jgi:hypothetical protein